MPLFKQPSQIDQLKNLQARNIYVDKKHRYIYYEVKTKKAYVIPPDDLQKFSTLQNRFILAGCITIVTYGVFHLGYLVSILAGAAVYLLLEFSYRRTLKQKYVILERFDPQPFVITDSPDQTISGLRSVIASFLFLVMGALAILSLFFNPHSQDLTSRIVMIVIASYAFYLSFKTFSTWLKNKGK